MEKENIYDKNYRLDLIEGIKNPRLKKLYQKWGINDTTYLLGQYFSDVLGDDHDLAVFGQVLQNHDGALEGDTSSLVYLAQGRQQELRAEARLLGERIYAKSPKSAVKTLAAHWKAWKSR